MVTTTTYITDQIVRNKWTLLHIVVDRFDRVIVPCLYHAIGPWPTKSFWNKGDHSGQWTCNKMVSRNDLFIRQVLLASFFYQVLQGFTGFYWVLLSSFEYRRGKKGSVKKTTLLPVCCKRKKQFWKVQPSLYDRIVDSVGVFCTTFLNHHLRHMSIWLLHQWSINGSR